jgi:C1A family cysteine protease
MTNALAGLGRLRMPDDRDRAHLIPRRATNVIRKTWVTPPAWDQGATSMCVAYGTNRFLASSPIRNKTFDFMWLYKEAQKLDQWPGENYDGTSVRAAFKVLQREKLVSGYQWAFEVEPVIEHVLTVGPVVMGTSWDDSMSNPGRGGYIGPGPNFAASTEGHCWTIIGADRKRINPDKSFGAVRMVNSWGTGWGEAGRAWITFRDLDTLIKQDGEAAVATEVLKP